MMHCALKRLGLTIVTGFAFSTTAMAADYQEQSWDVHPIMIEVLHQVLDEIPEHDVEGYQSYEQIDLATASCKALIEVPRIIGAIRTAPTNRIRCVWENRDTSPGHLSIAWDTVPFQYWGNRPELQYRLANNLPLIFQTRDDAFNKTLFRGLAKVRKLGHNRIDHSVICGPNGYLCLTSYDIDFDPEMTYSQVHLSCTIDTEGGAFHGSRCVFFYPTDDLK